MKKLIKVISAILSVLILFGCVQVGAFASSEDCTPTIYVIGIASYDVTDKDGNSVFPLGADDLKASLKKALKDTASSALTLDVTSLVDVFVSIAYSVFSPAACDNNGNPVVESGVVWDYPAITKDNHSGVYRFIYDWRLDPVEVAAQFSDFVNYVCENSGHDKVDVTAFSLGSCIFNAYYEFYSNNCEHIRNVTYLSPACNGVGIAADVFNGELGFDSKALAKYIDYYFLYVMGKSYADVFFDTLSELGVLDILTVPLNVFKDKAKHSAYYDVILPIFATMPCMWAMLPAEYYESAKDIFFGENNEEYKGLIEKLDRYHYAVQLKNDERLKALYESDEHSVAVIAKYNLANMPLTDGWQSMSDGIVDTKHSSFGATCCEQNSTLPSDYVQSITGCSHNHISPDRMVDASTCVIPEATWFVRDLHHSDSNSGLDRLVEYVQKTSKQVSIWDDEKYPQFLKSEDGDIVLLTDENSENQNVGVYEKYSFLHVLLSKIRAYILAFLNTYFGTDFT